jgi:signal transduction histidine kinase
LAGKVNAGRLPVPIFIYFTALWLLHFGYKYLDEVAHGHSTSPLIPLIEEFTGTYSVLLLVPLLFFAARKFPFRRRGWPKVALTHFGIATVFSFLHTSMMAVSRNLIFPAVGLGPYDYGRMPTRYFMEYCNDLVSYAFLVSLIYLFDHYRAAKNKEIATAQLENKLAQAQLQNLRLQLHPHFIFNAMNTISSVMYEDVRAADEMISRLSEFLRVTLHSSQAQEVTLEDELRVLELYLNVMRARFEDRLSVAIDVEKGSGTALVPQLILQPLVENSIRHGVNPQTSQVQVEVTARRHNGSLLLEVRDHGPGLAEDREGVMTRGIGLSNTAERLSHLYGEGQALRLENSQQGGLVVTVEVPFHTASRS